MKSACHGCFEQFRSLDLENIVLGGRQGEERFFLERFGTERLTENSTWLGTFTNHKLH